MASALTIFLLCLSAVYGLPTADMMDSDYAYSNDYSMDDSGDYSGDERVISRTPKFQSQAVNRLINEGDTIKLPCHVDKLDGFVMMWKRGTKEYLAIGKNLMYKDSRFKLEENENGNTLIISLAEPQDAGEYTCLVSSNQKAPVLRHVVRVRVAPEVRPNPRDGTLIVHEGETAKLSCDVIKGSPAPEITWRRKERNLPDGKKEIRGQSLQYFQVTRKHSGIYICSADNGFGSPVEATIKVNVQHKPRIEMEHTFIHTKEDDETEVVCTVHASPKADVVWTKNGQPLPENQGIVTKRGNRHTLILVPKPGHKESTFGVYACKATNKFGTATKSTEVSGKATPPNFKSEPEGSSENEFVLEWVAESITNITTFKVEYKAMDGGKAAADDIIADEAEVLEGWTEVVVVPTHSEDNFFNGKHTIRGLRPETRYVARVSSKNDYGFSSPKAFMFGTKGAGPIQSPSVLPSAASSSRSSSTVLVAATAILLPLLILSPKW